MSPATEVLRTDELDAATVESLHNLWRATFGDTFTAEDAYHAFGGLHALIRDEQRVTSHASVVPRTILIGDQPFHAGYVEAVATLPELQRHGLGSQVMTHINVALVSDFEIGVLSTGRATGFYQRLGWERWRGPSYVLQDGARLRTADEDDGLMVFRCRRSASVDVNLPIACHDRPGDAW